jgi:hypothetical protein
MLLGFPKCGSTSLFDLIHQHPQIKRRLPWFKEIHSLDATGHAQGLPFHDLKGWAAENWSAKQRFSSMLPTNLEHDELCGDGTPWYSIFFDAARIAGRLRIWSPRVRLILLMRQPVRAEWSMQCHAFRMHKAQNVARLKSYHPANVRYCGVNSSTVGTCMAHGAATRLDEEIGLQQLCNSATVVQERGAWPRSHWARPGQWLNYAERLELWFEVFPKESFLFLSTDTLEERPLELLAKVEYFLGLRPFNRYTPVALNLNPSSREKGSAGNATVTALNHPLRCPTDPHLVGADEFDEPSAESLRFLIRSYFARSPLEHHQPSNASSRTSAVERLVLEGILSQHMVDQWVADAAYLDRWSYTLRRAEACNTTLRVP